MREDRFWDNELSYCPSTQLPPTTTTASLPTDLNGADGTLTVISALRGRSAFALSWRNVAPSRKSPALTAIIPSHSV